MYAKQINIWNHGKRACISSWCKDIKTEQIVFRANLTIAVFCNITSLHLVAYKSCYSLFTLGLTLWIDTEEL